MDRRSINLALAGSLAAALSLLAIAASAQDAAKEKCYGVALKGQTTAPPAPEPPVPAPPRSTTRAIRGSSSRRGLARP